MNRNRTRPRMRRSIAVTAALASLALGSLVASPASAKTLDGDALVFVPFHGQTATIWRNSITGTQTVVSAAQSFAGDFSSAAGTDLFLYTPGSGPDGILHISPDGTSFTSSFTPKSVSGAYIPIVGDFDGNGVDDVLWYAPGPGADVLWRFNADGSVTPKTVSINGSYMPTAIDVDGDGDTDIIWYAPGTAADSIWRFDASANHTTKAVTINGNYRLIPGHFGNRPDGSPQQRLLFFNPSGADSIWTFDTSANHTSAAVPNVDGTFTPIVGRFTTPDADAVLFYRPGTGGEQFLSFTVGGTVDQLEPPKVNGTYDVTVGDYDGNGYSDIAWAKDGKATVWEFNDGGYSPVAVSTSTPNTLPRTIVS